MTTFDAGLLNLKDLRERIRSVDLNADDDHDTALRGVARGVAAKFETECGRKLTRFVDRVEYRQGGTDFYSVECYPIETLTSVELQETYAGDWTAATIQQVFENAGTLFLESAIASDDVKVRITLTGGFWHDDSEDSDGTLPTGATELPEDIKAAFALQVAHEVMNMGIFSGGIDTTIARTEDGEAESMNPASIDLLPYVVESLWPYRKIV